MTKYLIISLSLLLLACGAEEEQELAAAPAKPSTVEVVKIEAADVARRISVPGTILPNEEVELFSEVSGRIKSIAFREGETVQKGQLLIQMDVDLLRAQKKQLNIDLELAGKDAKRKSALFAAQSISEEEVEKAKSALESAQAKVELLEVQLSKSAIRAPFSGRIGLRRVSEGAFITPSTLIATLVQENPVKIEFAVSERYASSVKQGQFIHFSMERDKKEYQAKVYAFEPKIDKGTRMITIRAVLNNPGKLISGAFVAVNYDLGNEVDAFMVPAESIIPILKGQKILVVRNGKVKEIPVEIGIRTADKVQVIGDIKSGEQVLISGLLAVREGMPVQTKLVQK